MRSIFRSGQNQEGTVLYSIYTYHDKALEGIRVKMVSNVKKQTLLLIKKEAENENKQTKKEIILISKA